MKIIVGLGNVGIQYAFTPHNFGFLVVDELARRSGARVDYRECQSLTGRATLVDQRVLLAKPETMMNLSGFAIRELLGRYQTEIADLLVIYDDLDLPLGTVRIRERGSAATHNGLRSVVGVLQTEEFLRMRLGIAPDHAITSGKAYVLSPWKKAQLETVQEVVVRSADAVEMLLREGAGKAMSIYNAVPEKQAGSAALETS